MKWNIVHECDNDNGEPTEWSCKLTEDGQFVWIDKIGECAYGIINKANAVYRTLEDMCDEGLLTEREYKECKV